jgi:hypothetical protein
MRRSNYRGGNPCEMLICLFVTMDFSRISREVGKEEEIRGAYFTTHVWG